MLIVGGLKDTPGKKTMFDWLFGRSTKSRLDAIEFSLRVSNRLNLSYQRSMKTMSAALDKLRAEVAENTAAVASAELLISGLAQQLRDAIGDEAALNALADELDASSNRLAQAVSDNTPAAGGGDTPAEPTDPAEGDTTGDDTTQGDTTADDATTTPGDAPVDPETQPS